MNYVITKQFQIIKKTYLFFEIRLIFEQDAYPNNIKKENIDILNLVFGKTSQKLKLIKKI